MSGACGGRVTLAARGRAGLGRRECRVGAFARGTLTAGTVVPGPLDRDLGVRLL
ncbi:hypothetical protein ACGFX8_36875 [Streptomyces sp. NPDC048362]|uniref:hypothetical protein n=1 Tax=Streptomyces sp. NPDC048362 TaxID=3365539 RepID=UPI003721F19D